jgi:hypothetical protein
LQWLCPGMAMALPWHGRVLTGPERWSFSSSLAPGIWQQCRTNRLSSRAGQDGTAWRQGCLAADRMTPRLCPDRNRGRLGIRTGRVFLTGHAPLPARGARPGRKAGRRTSWRRYPLSPALRPVILPLVRPQGEPAGSASGGAG